MTYVVEVRRIGDCELEELLSQMQRWMHERRIVAEAIDQSHGGPGIAFRIDFSGEADAIAFAAAFAGRLTTADPHGAVLWIC